MSLSIIYETFTSTSCDLGDVRQFAADVNRKFPGSELAADEPFAGKLVVPVAPSVDCYRAEADNYRVRVYGQHAPDDLMHVIDWGLPTFQSLNREFDSNAALAFMRIGISYVGSGANPRYKAKTWQPNVALTLSSEVLKHEERARKLAELIGAAGFVPPKLVVKDNITFLRLPDDASYSVEGLRPDVDTEFEVGEPTSMTVIVEKGADSVLRLAEKLLSEMKAGEPVCSTFGFNAEDASEYGQLKDRFSVAIGQAVWHVKPRVPLLSDSARQALSAEGNAEGLDVLPVLEISDKKDFHPVSAIRRGDQWQIVVGTFAIDRKTKLQEMLSPFVNGWE